MDRKWRVLLGALVCIGGVIAIGVLTGKQREKEADSRRETQTSAGGNRADSFMSDRELLEEKGNMYEAGEYVSFGGFGYQLTGFGFCDSFEDVLSDPLYSGEGMSRPLRMDKGSYAWAEVSITNESDSPRKCYTEAAVNLWVGQDGHQFVEGRPELGLFSHVIFVGGIGDDAINLNKSSNLTMEPGEAIQLKYYFEYCYLIYTDLTEDPEDDDAPTQYFTVEEIWEKPEYYICADDYMTGNKPEVDAFRDDLTHIFFRCYPEEKQ